MSLLPLETPVLKVSRPVAACSRCRNAKIKCDGKLPACTSCEKNGKAAECTSTNEQFARGKERSYVSTLETRVEKLQAKIESARARKPSVVSIPDDETAVPSRRTSLFNPEPPTPTTSRVQRRKEVSAIDDLASDFGFLSVNATTRDFYGFTSAMTYARLILSACTKDPLPEGTTKSLPARYAASGLIQCYFDNIFALLPTFDEASFYASVENVYANNPHSADTWDHWIVRMVLAIASISISDQRGDQHYLEGIGHVCAALEYAEDVLHPGAIANVQALVLLTQYAMLDPHHFDSWNLIGAASRAMTDLGLHQDPPKGTEMSKKKLELRRRVFYCIYALDRSTSLVQIRAFSFTDQSVNVKIPFHKQPSSTPTSPQAEENSPKPWLQAYDHALDLIKLRQLQSTWYSDLFQSGRMSWEEPYAYLWDTIDGMRQWFENLSVSTSSGLRTFFELELLYSYVYVLSPSPRVPFIELFAQHLIFEYSIRYADAMLHLIDDNPGCALVSFYDAMRVYFIGHQFLDALTHSTEVLLSGRVPPHPEVRPSAAPPPQLPIVSPPLGVTLYRHNLTRSVQCIKQFTECLAKFGIRWGYMSWNQRFQKETATILEDLNRRIRDQDEMNGTRRPSMWAGSVGSSNGSLSYASSVSVGQNSVAYVSPPMERSSFGSTDFPNPLIDSPPMFTGRPNRYASSQHLNPQHAQVFQQQQQTQHTFSQQQTQSYEFAERTAPHHRPPFPTAPNQQFANWGGYSTAGGSVPHMVDEEEEIAPNAPWGSYGEAP